jgi:ATP-dependent helicase Lhr and Lhr-like helicase
MLIELMTRIEQRRVRMVEVETATPSPYAASLLFGYVGAFMYEGDAPLAERRAAALSLDTTLLAELLGRVELRELLDPDVVTSTHRQLQHLSHDRLARDAEGIADLLRLLGPLTQDELAERSTASDLGGWLEGLRAARRAVTVSYAGRTWWVAVEDIGRLRDGVGIAVPPGVPVSFSEPVADPLGELIGRYARTRGPFTTADAAERFGLGVRVAADVLGRLASDGRLTRGEFVAATADVSFPASAGADQWCDTDVLRILRRRTLAALRAQVEPVSTAAYGRFLPAWQQVNARGSSGIDGLAAVIEQLAGVAVPASAIEPLVLSQRVSDYQPGMLDELLAAGEVTWSGHGAISTSDGWIALHTSDTARLSLTPPAEIDFTDRHRMILDTLGHGGGFFFRQLADGPGEEELKAALWDLVWAGWVTGDTFAPVRALLAGTRRHGGRRAPAHRHRHRPPRLSRYSLAHPQARTADPTVAGRWSALPSPETDSTLRAHFQAELLLGRYGVLTKGSVAAEAVPGGFATLYKVLTTLEDAGRCQRGYFVESLGGAQFAAASTVDRLRSYQDTVDADHPAYKTVVLAAADPANPYGSALPWPPGAGDSAHRPGRRAGALVVLVDGELAWFLERGGKSLLNFVPRRERRGHHPLAGDESEVGTDDAEAQRAAAGAVADLVGTGRVESILIERLDGVPVLDLREPGPVAAALIDAGFARTPRGLRLR